MSKHIGIREVKKGDIINCRNTKWVALSMTEDREGYGVWCEDPNTGDCTWIFDAVVEVEEQKASSKLANGVTEVPSENVQIGDIISHGGMHMEVQSKKGTDNGCSLYGVAPDGYSCWIHYSPVQVVTRRQDKNISDDDGKFWFISGYLSKKRLQVIAGALRKSHMVTPEECMLIANSLRLWVDYCDDASAVQTIMEWIENEVASYSNNRGCGLTYDKYSLMLMILGKVEFERMESIIASGKKCCVDTNAGSSGFVVKEA